MNRHQAEVHALWRRIRDAAADDVALVDGRPTEVWFHLQMLQLAMVAADTLTLLAQTVSHRDRHRRAVLVELERRLEVICNTTASVIEAVPQ